MNECEKARSVSMYSNDDDDRITMVSWDCLFPFSMWTDVLCNKNEHIHLTWHINNAWKFLTFISTTVRHFGIFFRELLPFCCYRCKPYINRYKIHIHVIHTGKGNFSHLFWMMKWKIVIAIMSSRCHHFIFICWQSSSSLLWYTQR